MATKVLKSNDQKSGKTFGANRLSDGTYTIVKAGRYQSDPTDFAPEGYEVLAIFVDDATDNCLQLNGCWRPRMAINDEGVRYPVKAHGTLYDALQQFEKMDFSDFCKKFNESSLVGRKFRLKWDTYISASGDGTTYSYVPTADLVEENP